MSRVTTKNNLPRPFLKWVGGKGQLLDELYQRVALAKPFKRYHEPFVGGGALFFELCRRGELGRSKAFLSDNNSRLIDVYEAIQENVEDLIVLLQEHKLRHDHDYYYAVRAEVPDDLIARAARIIYMNKTCYNGLFRENSRGEFNVPMGRYKNPMICDEDNLRAVAAALTKARVEQRPFASILDRTKEEDLVYFDPPYDPVSKTASFTGYHLGQFGEDGQHQLADVFHELTRKGIRAILSNSMTPLIRTLYKGKPGVVFESVSANRNVNSRADRRGKVSEALIRNF
jgi:DNA adenine methylase